VQKLCHASHQSISLPLALHYRYQVTKFNDSTDATIIYKYSEIATMQLSNYSMLNMRKASLGATLSLFDNYVALATGSIKPILI